MKEILQAMEGTNGHRLETKVMYKYTSSKVPEALEYAPGRHDRHVVAPVWQKDRSRNKVTRHIAVNVLSSYSSVSYENLACYAQDQRIIVEIVRKKENLAVCKYLAHQDGCFVPMYDEWSDVLP